jgi:hypothetical protein
MQFKVKSISFFEQAICFKKPFRFGAFSLEKCPQVHTRVEIEAEDGCVYVGASAELLVPKWFDKRVTRNPDENTADLYLALFAARNAMLSDPAARTVFDHCQIVTDALAENLDSAQLPGLVRSFGVAQIEKALIDAVCRSAKRSFASALRANLFGLRFDTSSSPDLSSVDVNQFLHDLKPRSSMALRYTVGFDAPGDDAKSAEAYREHLHALATEVRRPKVGFLKIKLSGDVARDIARLSDVADAVFQDQMQVTLDGNEQYQSVQELALLLEEMQALEKRSGHRIFSNCLFIEQAFTREIALQTSLPTQALSRSLIIDESDEADISFLTAKQCGYRGISSKACKGVMRAVLNIARAQLWSQEEGVPYFVSPEDLCTQVGWAFQQDLALAAFSGSAHIERNGFQYVRPFEGWSQEDIPALVQAHDDLYVFDEAGTPLYQCSNEGVISCLSVNQTVGFGCAIHPVWTHLTEVSV